MVDQKLKSFLIKLGIGDESASIYLDLVGKPARTAKDIAESCHIPKTTVYRRLEELISQGLIEERIEEYKRLYESAPPETLKLIISKKEQEIHDLASELPLITDLFSTTKSFDPETKVLFYRGQDGIKQMNWNVLKTKGEFCGYTFRAWEEIVGKRYVEDFHREFLSRQFPGRELYSHEYLKSRNGRPDPIPNWKNWETRYLDPKIVDIAHQMDIYNDVVAIYNWHEGEVFGIEIYNKKITTMQKQIFEVLWKISSPNNKYKHS